MTTKKSAAKRNKNRLPPGGEWRDGHPIWRPHRALRAAGWRAYTLRHADGSWLSQGEAVDKINQLNAAIANLPDEPIPAWMATFSPAALDVASPAPAAPLATDRSIGALIAAYHLDPMPHSKPLKPKTRKHYKTYLNQFIATVAELRGVSPAAIRAQPIGLLRTPEPDSGDVNYAKEAYKHLLTTKGVNVAAATFVAAKAWFSWLQHTRHLLVANPCAGTRHVKPKGPIYIWLPHEVDALVRAAEWIGLDSVADAIILALDLTWSQADILDLEWTQVTEHHRVHTHRIKTNVEGNPRAAKAGRERLDQIRKRWTGPEHLRPAAVILCEAGSGRDKWKADYFRHAFALVRDIASAEVGPGILSKTYMKLRNTGITHAYRAGLDAKEVAARSMHTPETALAIHEVYRHFNQDDQDAATDKLDAPRKRRPRLAAVN
jgi:hypothetical protein